MIKITCDKCGKDVSEVNSGYDEYRFTLSYESIPNICQIRYSVYRTPPLPGVMEFLFFKVCKRFSSGEIEK